MSSNEQVRICKQCKVSKAITEFNKDGKYFRTECKKMYSCCLKNKGGETKGFG